MNTKLHFRRFTRQWPGLLTSVNSCSASDEVSSLSCTKRFHLLTDLEHVLRGPIHHPVDGTVLHLHWSDIQRLFLQVPQHLRLWMECESHVHSGGVAVSVSVKVYVFIYFVSPFLIFLFFLGQTWWGQWWRWKPVFFIQSHSLLCVLPTVMLISKGTVFSLLIRTWREFSTGRILSESTRWVELRFNIVRDELHPRSFIIIPVT